MTAPATGLGLIAGFSPPAGAAFSPAKVTVNVEKGTPTCSVEAGSDGVTVALQVAKPDASLSEGKTPKKKTKIRAKKVSAPPFIVELGGGTDAVQSQRIELGDGAAPVAVSGKFSRGTVTRGETKVCSFEIPKPASIYAANPAEHWDKHFELVERTPGGKEVVLKSGGSSIVDSRSTLFLRRTSDAPKSIKVLDDPKTWKSRFRARATLWKPKSAGFKGRCGRTAVISGLNQPGGKSTRSSRATSDCPDTGTTFNQNTTIEKGETFSIDTRDAEHGDRLHLMLDGEQIGLRDTKLAACKKAPCAVGPAAVPALNSSWDVTFLAFDRIRPQQHLGTQAKRVEARSGRRFDAKLPVDFDIASSGYKFGQNHIKVSYHVKSADGKEADKKCSWATPRSVSCDGFTDGDQVTFRVSRVFPGLADAPVEEISIFRLEAADFGFHYSPIGHHRAYYSTATGLGVQFPKGEAASLTFIQTAAYSMYYKSRRYPGVEAISYGAHVSLVASDTGVEAVGEKDPAVRFGIGGQLNFGWDALQLGGGFDFGTQSGYLLFGISLPDTFQLFKRINGKAALSVEKWEQ